MKALIIGVLAVTLIGGCSIAQPKQKLVKDSTYISQVEAVARQRGVEVHWVNPPVQRVERKEKK